MATSLWRSGQLLMSMYPPAGRRSLVQRHTVTPSNSRSMKNRLSTCVPAVLATAQKTYALSPARSPFESRSSTVPETMSGAFQP